MKNLNNLIILFIALSMVLASCGDDDENGINLNQENELLAIEQNASEETKIPATVLNTSINIDGASKEAGTPPAPNSDLDFQINTNQQEAFQETGLAISFSSNASVAGAYVQFKDVDGNLTSGYFDIPSTSFSNGRKGIITSNKTTGLLKYTSNGRTNEDGDTQIDVDFEATIPAGQFCYDICLYDENNNISQIQTVCVTVEAWGGNAAIIGEWVFDRFEPENFEEDKAVISCDNGQSITVDYEINSSSVWTFVLNADGTYYETVDETEQELNFSETQATCSAVYEEEEQYIDKYSGFWAYNEEAETLTVVDFKYEDLLNPSNNEDYEGGSLYFEGVKAEVINGEFVLTDTSDDETYKAFFKRK